MRLTKLELIEVGDLEEQYRRPFEFNTDGDILQKIEGLVRSNAGRLSSDLFISTASDALRLSSDVEEVGIGGRSGRRAWKENRYRFIAHVDLENYNRGDRVATRAIVIGYTDRADLSHNDTVADDLEMYVNSIAIVRDVERRDKRGRVYTQTKLVDSQQALLGDLDFDAGNVEYMMRPFDLFNTVDSHRDTGRSDDSIDFRCLFQYGVELTDRNTNSSNRYLSRVVQADRQGAMNMETYSNDILDQSREVEAADILRPQRVDSNLFLKALASRTGYGDNNFFEYRDLVPFTDRRNLKDLDAVTYVWPMARNRFSFESEEWHGASPETMAAMQVCHAVPIIMLNCLFSAVEFTVSNRHGYDNRVEFILNDMASYVGPDFNDRRVLDLFENRIVEEVFNPISLNGYMDVEIKVSSEVGGMTRIELEIDDGPMVPYVFPSFADAMISPVITRDKNLLDDNADSYIELRKTVDDAIDDLTGEGVIDTTSRIRNGRVEENSRPRNRGLDLIDIDLPNTSRRRSSKPDII